MIDAVEMEDKKGRQEAIMKMTAVSRESPEDRLVLLSSSF